MIEKIGCWQVTMTIEELVKLNFKYLNIEKYNINKKDKIINLLINNLVIDRILIIKKDKELYIKNKILVSTILDYINNRFYINIDKSNLIDKDLNGYFKNLTEEAQKNINNYLLSCIILEADNLKEKEFNDLIELYKY